MGKAEADGKKKLRMFGRRKQTLLFQVGRVCVINYGPDVGKLCVILDFVDSTRALIDGPQSMTGVARGTIPFRRLSVTPLMLKIIRSCKTVKVEKAFRAGQIGEKFKKLPWGRKLERAKIRRNLTDFDRFKVMILRKKRAHLIRCQVTRSKTQAKRRSEGKFTHMELYQAAKRRGDEKLPEKFSEEQKKRFVEYRKKWAAIEADPNDPRKRPKRRWARSSIRSKKRSEAHKARRAAYMKHRKFKRSQTAKKVPRDDKKKRRVRKKKTLQMYMCPRGATPLPRNATVHDVKMHKKRYHARRAKFKRTVKKARLAKARAAKKELKEFRERRKALKASGEKPTKE